MKARCGVCDREVVGYVRNPLVPGYPCCSLKCALAAETGPPPPLEMMPRAPERHGKA